MSNVNYYLKKPSKSGSSLIFLQFKYFKRKLLYSFKQTVEPENWNSKKQRVKNNSTTTHDGKFYINELLDNLEGLCLETYHKLLKEGIPEPTSIRKVLEAFMNKNHFGEVEKERPTLFKLIERFITGEIKFKGKDKSLATIKSYRTTKRHLLEFQTKENYPIDFDTITLDFFYKFVHYLKNVKGMRQNGAAKYIKTLKVFMNEAIDLGYTTNLQFRQRKFSMPETEIEAVYLTEPEILRLFSFDFSSDERFERVRDLFVFGCFVGLRYSDYSKIQPENIIKIDDEYFIKKTTQKTGEQVIIPCNPIVLQIFKKYKDNPNRLPKAYCDVKFNKHIKEVLKAAGFVEEGRLLDKPSKQLWECVSSHTARRSFATNFYLQGFPTIDLMKITGHRTEKSFLRYIRVTKLDTAKRLSLHIKKNWKQYLHKVA